MSASFYHIILIQDYQKAYLALPHTHAAKTVMNNSIMHFFLMDHRIC